MQDCPAANQQTSGTDHFVALFDALPEEHRTLLIGFMRDLIRMSCLDHCCCRPGKSEDHKLH